MFKIGENIVLNKFYNDVKVKNNIVNVLAPARLHISIMNPYNMILEKLGGGGIGLALNLNNIITIEVIENNEDIIIHEKKAVIEHFLIIMRKLFNSNIHFKVSVQFDPNMKEHCGLASNSMLSSAIIYGVNHIFGDILTKYELVEILDNNFVESHENFLVKDICTGIAHNTCFFGGLCIVSADGKLINKYNFPEYYKIFLIKADKINKKDNIKTEQNIVQLLQQYDNNTYLKKSYIILNHIIPDLDKNNFDSLFKYNYTFQHYNNEKNVLDFYFINNVSVRNFLLEFEKIPNVMAGLSTNAKYVYIISKNTELIKDICSDKKIKYSLYSVNNNGVAIT